ncbi:MAG TPA: ribosomal protein S18-alanine N-acetyltransferase [Dermatophilaceae bacterium]
MTIPGSTHPATTATAAMHSTRTPEAVTPEAGTPRTTAQRATLREMTWRDIPALAALEPALFVDDAWLERTWWAELAGRPRRSYVVAVQNGTVVGYAGVNRGGEVADVMTIAVAPAAQGRGMGSVLLDWLIADARHSGAEHLMLEVRADNVVAQRLYSAAGFATLTVRRKYYQPGDVDALIMRRHLSEMAADKTEDVPK